MRSIEFAELHIPIASVKQGDSRFEFHVPKVAGMREEISFPDGIVVNADVHTLGDDFLADIEVEGRGVFTCDRCGKEFSQKLEGKVQTLFGYGNSVKAEKAENDEMKLLQPSDRHLDISGDVTDALFLSIPGKKLCDENCRGLCYSCGADLNTETCMCAKEDPASPWDALKNIRFK